MSCASAGTHIPETNLPKLDQENAILIEGYAGIGGFNHAEITVIDVSGYDHPIILGSTVTNSEGYFSIELELQNETSLLQFTTNEGQFVDPISFKTHLGRLHQLSAVYHVKDFVDDKLVYITPMTTLFSSLVDCLALNSSVKNDPYYYAKSVYQKTFGLNIGSVSDLYLNPKEKVTDENRVFTLFNLTFSKMSDDFQMNSPLEITEIFEESVNNGCSLLQESSIQLGLYSTHRESFREDFLNSFLALQSQSSIIDLSDSVDFESVVNSVRLDSGLLFRFENYE